MRLKVIAMLIVAIVMASMATYVHLRTAGKRTLVIFCAGSLYTPLERLASVFEERHKDVDVVLEPSGSVMAVRKVTELERRCDVLVVADYRLIESLAMPKYAKWCVAFASNEVVLAYLNHSKYADQVN